MGWKERLQSALDTEAHRPGYYKWPLPDRKTLLYPPDKRWRLPRAKNGRHTSGTCGHHATWLVCGMVGDPQARVAATGMNSMGSRHVQAQWWDGQGASNCTVALLDGLRTVLNPELDKDKQPILRPYACVGYADLFRHRAIKRMDQVLSLMEPGIAIVECPSHIEVAIMPPPDVYLSDPRECGMGKRIEGVWQYSADGTGKNPGQRRTLRPWKKDEPGPAIHFWLLPWGSEVPGAVDWRVEVEA